MQEHNGTESRHGNHGGTGGRERKEDDKRNRYVITPSGHSFFLQDWDSLDRHQAVGAIGMNNVIFGQWQFKKSCYGVQIMWNLTLFTVGALAHRPLVKYGLSWLWVKANASEATVKHSSLSRHFHCIMTPHHTALFTSTRSSVTLLLLHTAYIAETPALAFIIGCVALKMLS